MNRGGWLVVLFFALVHVPEGRAALSKSALEGTKRMMKGLCKRSSGVKQELLNQMRSGDFVEDQKLKCYVHCCLGMMKTMKKDQITVVEARKQVEQLLPDDIKEVSLKQLNECKDVTGKDACDKAYNFVKCCNKVDSSNWLIPT